MTTSERRLEGLTADLTARERAILVMQKWLREEEFDKKLRDQKPPEQEAEYDRIVLAVEKANNDLRWILRFEQLYLFESEIHLGWLESLVPALERGRILEKALKATGARVREGELRRPRPRLRSADVLVPPLPVVTKGFDLAEPIGGERVGEDFSAQCLSGDSLVNGLISPGAGEFRVAVPDDCFDRNCVSRDDGGLRWIQRRPQATQTRPGGLSEPARKDADAQSFGAFPLPPPTEAQLARFRQWGEVEAIRDNTPASTTEGRSWESDYAKTQRDEANATWRQQLDAERAKRGGQDKDVFTPGSEG